MCFFTKSKFKQNLEIRSRRETTETTMVCVIESREELEKAINDAGEKLVVIDFFANWCGPCKIISPKLEELANQYSEQAVVLKVNVDDNDELALDYNVTSMPTFVFIKNQKIIEVFVGGNPDKLTKNMEKYISGSTSTTTTVAGTDQAENNSVAGEVVVPSTRRGSTRLESQASAMSTGTAASAASIANSNTDNTVATAAAPATPAPAPEVSTPQRFSPNAKANRKSATSQTVTK